ncbi:MAG: VOC family protein [Bacteroidetes bacterium]|nr:VOC family protein [Bacteroidota bacterium]
MNLGQHHIALNVKSLQASKSFYQKMGFVIDERFSNEQQKYLIMRNGQLIVGLYEGVIPRNTITFSVQHIFELQKQLKEKGIPFVIEAKEGTSSGKHFLVLDPDGNPLFFEQH